MKFRTRAIANLIAAATLSALAPAAFAQQAYPSKPVRVIVGLAPGGATDIQARLFSAKLTEDLKQSFIVENRPGAGELVGIQAVRNSAPDGYTILAVTTGLTVVPAFREKAPYDPVKDFAPISLLTMAPYMVVVNPNVPARTFQEFIAYAKANPGQVNFAVASQGSIIQLGALWISSATNTNLTIVPFKGTGPVLQALMAGQVHASLGNPISTLTPVKAGKLRALAVTSPQRSKALPDIPTVAESGIPGYDNTTWHGWLAPRDTSRDIVNRLNAAVVKMINTPEISTKLLAEGAEVVGNTPEQFTQQLMSEAPRWRKLVQDTGAKME
jgi:tripartite-type tricarboxylate transporter receptor subunit TctC